MVSVVVFVQILYKSNKNALIIFGLGELDEKESGFILNGGLDDGWE